MSQLLQQVHINQRLLKESDNSNPASPMLSNGSVLSPMALNPSSPQGMPIPKRNNTMQDGGTWMVNQNLLTGGGANQATWNGLNGFNLNQDLSYDLAMDALEVPEISGDLDSFAMEGELSKLSMAVDDDDIFKSENADLLGPTLAELNAPDADTLLDGLNFDDLYWPPETVPSMDSISAPSPQTPIAGNTMDATDAVEIMLQAQQQQQQQQSQASSLPASGMIKIVPTLGQSVPIVNTILEQTLNQPTLTLTTTADLPFLNQTIITTTPQTLPQSGGLRELLLRRDLQNSLESPDPSALGQAIPRSTLSPSPGPPGSPRLSSSAPSQGNTPWEQWQQRREQVWQRREPRPHLISTGSLAEGSASSISENVLSPSREFSLSMDEGFDSDDNSDNDSSDGESDVSDTESNNGKRERFFWQYNVQAKGPKGQRLVLAPTQEDPHVLQRPTDPVFSPLCHIQGIKHSGKARKGDGNDLTPNPRKLWSIGKELDRLNKVIAEMTPVADVPNAVKSRSRKEKNKLASRACRLKKKAQHEANKLKLFGLEQEHKRLLNAIDQSRQMIFAELDGTGELTTETLSSRVETIAKTVPHRIGGHTTEFVNKVLEKVDSGVTDGGIGEL